jgi:hypothetical protein
MMGPAMSSTALSSHCLRRKPLHSAAFGQPKQYRDSPLRPLSCSTAPTVYAFRPGSLQPNLSPKDARSCHTDCAADSDWFHGDVPVQMLSSYIKKMSWNIKTPLSCSRHRLSQRQDTAHSTH